MLEVVAQFAFGSCDSWRDRGIAGLELPLLIASAVYCASRRGNKVKVKSKLQKGFPSFCSESKWILEDSVSNKLPAFLDSAVEMAEGVSASLGRRQDSAAASGPSVRSLQSYHQVALPPSALSLRPLIELTKAPLQMSPVGDVGPPRYAYEREVVEFLSQGVKIRGLLFKPTYLKRRLPAVTIMGMALTFSASVSKECR